jgi:hypothetical protein
MRLGTALCATLVLTLLTCAVAPAHAAPATVRVLVVNFDPRVPGDGNQRLSSLFFNDPRALVDGCVADLEAASHGSVDIEIVEWRDIDAFPVKEDGFVYDPDDYAANWRNGSGWHSPDTTDYPKMIADYGFVDAIESGIDEVWMFGGPYFGFWEASMAGPGAFFINGGVYGGVEAPRPFAIMGFNYERGVAEMLHDFCHRTEFTMKRVYGGWDMQNPQTPWDRFTQNALDSPAATAAVGTCHNPPNAESGYDYANPRTVQSNADAWLSYPDVPDNPQPVNRETWGGPDYHRGYMNWWFQRLPHAPGQAATGHYHNWWLYVFAFTDVPTDPADIHPPPAVPAENVDATTSAGLAACGAGLLLAGALGAAMHRGAARRA